MAPVALLRLGRVAVADEVAESLGARRVVMLIGERFGLSSPDSMGSQATWAPKVGLTDAFRNCISNVQPAGSGVEAAAEKLHDLLVQMQQRQLSGVQLKDDTPQPSGLSPAPSRRHFFAGLRPVNLLGWSTGALADGAIPSRHGQH